MKTTFQTLLTLTLAAVLGATTQAQSIVFAGGGGGTSGSNVSHSFAQVQSSYSYDTSAAISSSQARTLTRYLKKASDNNSGRCYARAGDNQATVDLYLRFDGDIVKTSSGTTYGASAVMSKSLNWTRHLDIFPVDPSMSVPIGPIVVSIGGNAGVGVEVKANASASMASLSASGSSSTAIWAYGRAWVMLGVPGFGCGVEVTANFARSQVAVNFKADNRKVTASGLWLFMPIVVEIEPFIWIIVKIYGPTIARFSGSLIIEELF